MSHPLLSRKKIHLLSLIPYLVGLATLVVTGKWWPGILLAAGIPLALRQFLLGRTYDAFMSLFVFIGAFITIQFDIDWEVLLPVLFTLGGVYLFFREYIDSQETPEDEEEEEINLEIEDLSKK